MKQRNLINMLALSRLAGWQLRQTWRMLLLVGLGIVTALLLATTVPLYGQVTANAGLHDELNGDEQRTDVVVQSTSTLISPTTISQAENAQRSLIQHILGPYLKTGDTQFWLYSPGMLLNSGDLLGLTGIDPAEAAPHMRALQGRLPRENPRELEILLPVESAQLMSLHIGDQLPATLRLQSSNKQASTGGVNYSNFILPTRLVGTFEMPSNDPYWHGETWHSLSFRDANVVYLGLTARTSLTSWLQRANEQQASPASPFLGYCSFLWHYRLDSSHISILHLDDLRQRLASAKAEIANFPALRQAPYLTNPVFYLPGDNTDLYDRYQARLLVVNVPLESLLLLICGLILFFISIMIDMLVEQQSEAIAILRSRGASRIQIIATFLAQCSAVSLLALLIGPLLAFPTTLLVMRLTLLPAEQGAISVLAEDPGRLLLNIGWLPLLVLLAILATMSLALIRATGQNILTRRREQARTRRRSLWQRLGWDGAIAVLALVGAAGAMYLQRDGVLTDQLRLLFLTPLSLFAVICLGLAALLLLMRGFSVLLVLLAAWTRRGRGAMVQLAFTHMARAPQEPIRMALLLALAIGFAIFSLIFVASQTQRITDVANYQVGSDIYGKPALLQNTVPSDRLHALTAAYHNIPGVVSATLGYTQEMTSLNEDMAFRFAAIDSSTFAQTARWTPGGQALDTLMKQLVPSGGYIAGSIPIIVDNATWQALKLADQPGQARISIKMPVGGYYSFTCVIVAHVDSLPIVSGDQNTYGILADYGVFAQAYGGFYGSAAAQNNLAANAVWLRVGDGLGTTTRVENTLSQGPLRLDNIVERQAFISGLSHDPLYSNILNGIILGALLTLLLAFVGNLVGAWQRARLRRINFAVLNALGATPAQIGQILNWEQWLIALVALLLGSGLGALLSAWLVPLLVFTGVTAQESSGVSLETFYSRQASPPVQLVIPPSLLLVLAAIIALCLCCLLLIARAGISNNPGQALRLSED